MAAPLKNSFSLDVIDRIASSIRSVDPAFPTETFVREASRGFLELELTQRARRISDALAIALPSDRREALRILTSSLGPPLGDVESDGMASFLYLPHVFFVAEHGLPHFEESMSFQHEVTRRFTAEFSIRAFIDEYPEETMAHLRVWAGDPDMHVRRLVSEGTRPRLPWAPRLTRFIENPAPVIELLHLLKDDPTEYVRRSVANNLNDISKDHPDLVVSVAADWAREPGRARLIRHALRSLVKHGHPGALAVLGYDKGDVRVLEASFEPDRVAIGGKTVIRVATVNESNEPREALVDIRVHFVKASGRTAPKVFKGGVLSLPPGAVATVRKTISLARHTTRTPYPGTHRVEVLINGVPQEIGEFEVVSDAG